MGLKLKSSIGGAHFEGIATTLTGKSNVLS
jgi:hypothetical protein